MNSSVKMNAGTAGWNSMAGTTDGVATYLRANPGDNRYNPPGDFSLLLYFKQIDQGADYKGIAHSRTAWNGYDGWLLHYESGQFKIWAGDSTAPSGGYIASRYGSTGSNYAGRILTLVLTKSGKTYSVYEDGLPSGSITVGGSSSSYTGGLWLGTNDSAAFNSSNNLAADWYLAAFFNRALSASEIANIQGRELGLVKAPPRRIWIGSISTTPPPSGGYGFIKVAGSWKTLSGTYVKVAGVWKDGHFSPKVSGAWKTLV
jgi:hypothetical protein